MAASSTSPITTRKARLDDATHVTHLGAHVFTVTYGHSLAAEELQAYLDEAYSVEAFTKDIVDPNKDLILAVNSEGIIVGFALLTRGSSEPCIAHLERYVELQRLYVSTAYQGYGVGKILAKQLEAMAREQGFKYMWLGVWEENHKAQKVYEKLCYELVGDRDFVVGGVVQTGLIMLKEL
ncbi:acyl-CoA N-acyltransferase [Exophiala viscosa]|uniref:Probable N-acetyltransferase 14 n=1 Tax=Exophiala viscosa TaxID=2486360 RepID=A0AAN6E7M3_9EURO|nr:acyl-CoA N-acyltransferase [Exophiala viscosa]KAI1627662.1 acyl-CoA N-acyltransferase [Exophiala viscosa]